MTDHNQSKSSRLYNSAAQPEDQDTKGPGQPAGGENHPLPWDEMELTAEEAEMAESLRALSGSIHPEIRYQTGLERQLVQKAGAEQRNPRRLLAGFGRSLAWGLLALLLVLGLAWTIQTFVPRPVRPASSASTHTPVTGQAPSPTADTSVLAGQPTAAAVPTATAVPTAAPTATLEPQSFTSPYQPGLVLALQAEFPSAPPEVTLYQQADEPAITIADAQAIAARLGIQGNVYSIPGEIPQQNIYVVTDGVNRVLFMGKASHFYYTADYANTLDDNGVLPSQEQQIQAAEVFLKSRGLLDFPYQVEPVLSQPGGVRFVPLLDSLPVRYSNFNAPQINVQIGSQGQVRSFEYTRLNFTESGSYPIRSAAEAWSKVTGNAELPGVEFNALQSMPYTLQTWQRAYPLGERIDLYGYLETLQPVESSQEPFLFFNNFPVAGNPSGLPAAAAPGRFMHLWGKFEPDVKGNRVLQVEGWEAAGLSDSSLEGTLFRDSSGAYLLVDNRQILLPDLPDAIPDGTLLQVRGVVLEETPPSMNWSIAQTGSASGGGGGGGPTFAELNLAGDSLPLEAPAPELPLNPAAQPGTVVEGARGVVYVVINEFPDGARTSSFFLGLDPAEGWKDGLYVSLEGPGLAGIQAEFNLPVRVWGKFVDTTASIPALSVDRFEPVYPGLQMQAWLGTEETVTLERQTVMRFTAQDGQQYILGHSIDMEPDAIIGRPGDTIVVEGVAYPDRKFAGYPVLNETSAGVAQGRTDLNGYQLQTSTPPVIPVEKLPASSAHQKAAVEKIELIYHTVDSKFYTPGGNNPVMYVQPVWRFSGHYEDGTAFEILVQALKEAYLR